MAAKACDEKKAKNIKLIKIVNMFSLIRGAPLEGKSFFF
mgnify:CR=1 FL=1